MRYITEKFNEVKTLNNQKLNFHRQSTSAVVLDDKNLIKFSSLFLQKLEKAIFSFNLKKFEDSYNYLLGSGIIKNEDEFGEVLLVITGFDKFITGEFLSKEKFPNKEFKVLKAFMEKIYFIDVNFLDAMRFLLSRLNLPKDSSLILNIIDQFSIIYYEDNKDYFKDINSIYLLSSTVLALNTMLHKSVPNMRVFKRDDFINMNANIDKQITGSIYDELKINKLELIHEYNELIYRRISFKEKKESDKNFKQNEVKDQNVVSDTESNNFNEINAKEMISLLKQGDNFTKYGSYGQPHFRFVKLSDDENRIIWMANAGCNIFTKTKFIEVAHLKEVYIGAAASKILEKYKIPLDFDSNCFSIVSSKRTLDLKNDDEAIVKKWYHAIKFLIKRTKIMTEFKHSKNNLGDFINKKEIVGDIWKTEILPQWQHYRKYVISKGRNLVNFTSVTNKKNKDK